MKKKHQHPGVAAMNASRPAKCRVCGVKIVLTHVRSLELCQKHKAEHFDAQKRANIKRLQDLRLQRRSTPMGQTPTVSRLPSRSREKNRARENQPMAPASPPRVNERSERQREAHLQNTDRATFSEAIALIDAPMREREGFRHGWMANTGAGKTTGIMQYLAHSPSVLTLIHDEAKLQAQYSGPVVERFQDAPDDASQIVFRGNVFRGTKVHPEYVCRLALTITRTMKVPVRVVIDELDRACVPSGRELDSPALQECLAVGRALGLSVCWSTQLPVRAPRAVIDLSSTLALGQLGPRSLNYLDERLCFDPAMLEVVPHLGRGDFVIWENGKPWNGKVYATPHPSSLPAHHPSNSSNSEKSAPSGWSANSSASASNMIPSSDFNAGS